MFDRLGCIESSSASPTPIPSADELSEFTKDALAFLNSRARQRRFEPTAWGDGPDRIGIIEAHEDPDEEADYVAAVKAWRQEVFDAGFGWLGGPIEYGGAGRSPVLDHVYRELEWGFDVPNQAPITSGTHELAPPILAYGSSYVKQRYLRPIFRGEVLCCQLLSEPDAGSDLASVRTSAARDGDDWIVTGHKVWTSYAHVADIAQLLIRTDAAAPKHHGLTLFMIEMDSPGIDVRPLRQMTGESHFNEVFLNEVRVPDAHRVGALGRGWQSIMATLASERASVGNGATAGVDVFERVRLLAEHFGMTTEPNVRQAVSEAYTARRILQLLTERIEELGSTSDAAALSSVMKVLANRQYAHIARVTERTLGPALLADTGAWGTFAWRRWVCGIPGLRIAGGTDEIQRNILAERALGLPRGPADVLHHGSTSRAKDATR